MKVCIFSFVYIVFISEQSNIVDNLDSFRSVIFPADSWLKLARAEAFVKKIQSVSLEKFLSKRFQNVWGHIKNTTFSKISSTKELVSTSGKSFGLSSQRCIAKTLWRFFGEVSFTIYFYSINQNFLQKINLKITFAISGNLYR